MSTTAQHTPGPWTAYTHTNGLVKVETPREVVAEIMIKTRPEEQQANASLISAAPELLAALRLLLAELESLRRLSREAVAGPSA